MRFPIKKIINNRVLVGFVFTAMVFSLVFVTVQMILAPTVLPEGADASVRVKGDFISIILLCAVGIAAMFLPTLLYKKAKITIPSGMFLAYAVFFTAPSI